MVAILARRMPAPTASARTESHGAAGTVALALHPDPAQGAGSMVLGSGPGAAAGPEAGPGLGAATPLALACQLAQRARFHQAEAMCHLADGHHLAALRALAADPNRPLGALRYTDALLGRAVQLTR
jgi:hypothetical protein